MEGGSMTETRLRGHARVLGANINTDLHCSSKYMPGKDNAYIAQHAFEQVAPHFIARFTFGDVIVAGENFGSNSSREQAVHVMRLIGVAAIVAPSFGRQFFRNAINNGLPLVECDIPGIQCGDVVDIDLARGSVKIPERDIERKVPCLSVAMQTMLAEGGLIPFLKRYPEWRIT
jgi:3-isopropylmalate dehydratase small subunit